MAATEVQVQFSSVHVLPNDELGPETWRFTATIDRSGGRPMRTVTAGNNDPIEVRPGDTIPMNWSSTVDVTSGFNLVVRLEARQDGTNDSVGSVQWLLTLPMEHNYDLRTRSSTGRFTAHLRVEITSLSPDARWMPRDQRPVIRPHRGSSDYSTIRLGPPRRFVRVCPVIPVPWGALPPIPRAVLRAHGSQTVAVDLSINQHELDTAREDLALNLNRLVNPAVIPAIRPADAGFDQRCARLFITQYRPRNLDLNQVFWCSPTSNVRFRVGAASQNTAQGQEVNAYGVPSSSDDEEEECRIELRWGNASGPLLTTYRAWAGRIRYIWCRANIIKCSASGSEVRNPPLAGRDRRTQVRLIRQQVALANSLLWQAGIQIVFDQDRTCYEGARPLAEGIFLIERPENYTFNVNPEIPGLVAPLLNARRRVLNIAYIHSFAMAEGRQQPAGKTTDRGLAEPRENDTLDGAPSTSWVRPSGFPGDAPARTVRMSRGGSFGSRTLSELPDPVQTSLARLAEDPTIQGVWAFCLTLFAQGVSPELMGAEVPLPDRWMILRGGQSLAHETGHALGLHHRGSGGNRTPEAGSQDGVNHQAGDQAGHGHPFNENLMSYGGADCAQDIDMIQCQVIRRNGLLRDESRPASARVSRPPHVWM